MPIIWSVQRRVANAEPQLSADVGNRIKQYVAALAARAAPVITGIGAGQSLRGSYPLNDAADRVSMSGFSEAEGNPLLLLAFVDGERLAERLPTASSSNCATRSPQRSLILRAHAPTINVAGFSRSPQR